MTIKEEFEMMERKLELPNSDPLYVYIDGVECNQHFHPDLWEKESVDCFVDYENGAVHFSSIGPLL